MYPESSIGSILTTNNSSEKTIKQQSPFPNYSMFGNKQMSYNNFINEESTGTSDFGISEFNNKMLFTSGVKEDNNSPIKMMSAKNFQYNKDEQTLFGNIYDEINNNNEYNVLRLSQIAEDDELCQTQKKNSIDSNDMHILNSAMNYGKENLLDQLMVRD